MGQGQVTHGVRSVILLDRVSRSGLEVSDGRPFRIWIAAANR